MSPSPERSPAVAIHGLRQSYRVGWLRKRKEVLHGLDLEVARGEFCGLVGPNGSGKSTLLRVIAGIDEASEGSVRVFERDPDSDEAKAATGFCPEDSPFPPELRAIDALGMIAALYGGAHRERARSWLERVGLAHAARERLGGFSRGMLRRFGLAQALIHEPQLILLDEPTAGLDALGFEVVERLLADARERGATLLVSSHLLSDLHARCERVFVLVDGRIAAQGSALELARSLGPRAALELDVSGLDERALAHVRGEIEKLGGSLDSVQPAQRNLLELYRRERSDRAS